MPLLSAFTPCGLLELSAETSDAENIYATLKNQLGSAFNLSQGTYEEAKLYAVAMQMAWARAIVKRVPREMHPLTCYDLLTTLETDWACVPSASDSLYTRQLRIAARKLLMRGSREEAIVTDLLAAVGSGFLKLNKIPVGSEANYPAGTPDTVGTFPLPALAPRFYRIGSVAMTGAPVTVAWTAVNASAAPLVGDKLTVEPDISGWSEAVAVTAVTIDPGTATGTLTATFTRSHSANAWTVTAAPLWLSNRYQLQVVVTAATSKDAESRRKIHDAMARHSRSCEIWDIAAATTSTTVGPYICGTDICGATVVGNSATF